MVSRAVRTRSTGAVDANVLTHRPPRTPWAGRGDASGAPRDQPQRHAGDLVRAGLGLALLGIGFLIAQRGEISLLERDAFRIVNDLPSVVLPVVWAVMQLGNVVAVPTLAGVALLTRRFRLARDLAVSGVLAYLAADLVKSVVQRERPIGLPVGEVLNEQVTGLGFISGHSAVAAALATAAAPYLARRQRRLVWALAWSVGLARIYVGAHLPLDVVGGIGAGWAIGSLVHWAFGVPRWEPSPRRIAVLLRRFGIPVDDLQPARVAARSSHALVGRAEGGRPVFVKVLDPDRYERDWLFRVARWFAVRDVKDADALAPLGQAAAHEALAAMTARERGVRVPAVLLARRAERGALVVQERLSGRSLHQLPAGDLGPELLDRVWHQVALLHRARIAHHDLVASNVMVDADGQPWLVDFGNAETGAADSALADDVAELLASLAVTADVPALVAAAVRQLGADPVRRALPGLAPLSLARDTRAQLNGRQDSGLAELRREVRDQLGLPRAGATGVVAAGRSARLAVLASGLIVLVGLPVIAGPGAVLDAVEEGGWRWLGGALAYAVLARVVLAVATLLSVERRISLGRASYAMTATVYAAVIGGGAGGRRVSALFLERVGVLPETAERAAVRVARGSVVAAGLVAATALVLGILEGRVSDWRVPESSVAVLLVGAAAFLPVAAVQLRSRREPGLGSPVRLPRGRRRTARASFTAAMRPRSAALVGAAAAGIVLESATLAAALHAVGADVPLLASTTVYAVLRLLWTVVPELWLPGVGEVTLLLALTALGSPLTDACAAVLVYRLLAFWVPVAIGATLLRSVQRTT